MAKKIQLLRGKEVKLKSATNPSGYVLSDGEFCVDTTQHKVFVGDANATPDGRFALANESDVKAMQTEVENVVQDVADIQTDYAKTASGNTISANSVAVGNAEGKLTGVNGTNGQVMGFGENGIPQAMNISMPVPAYNHMASATIPATGSSPVSVSIPGMPADCNCFLCMPAFTEWTSQPRNWNRLVSVVTDDTAGRILFHHTNSIDVAIPFVVFWTA